MITQKELKEVLHYEPETGKFTWKGTGSGRSERVGCINKVNGYVRIKIKGKQYSAHRLAWLYMKGYFPEYQIDHKDGVRDDNRWENLRHVTRSCNMQNRKTSRANTSGFPGVCWNKQHLMWAPYICINGSCKYLGLYNSSLEAALVRYTVEVQCPKWTCNHRSKLVQAIQEEWPDFKIKQ